jgi:hypothetical protein
LGFRRSGSPHVSCFTNCNCFFKRVGVVFNDAVNIFRLYSVKLFDVLFGKDLTGNGRGICLARLRKTMNRLK